MPERPLLAPRRRNSTTNGNRAGQYPVCAPGGRQLGYVRRRLTRTLRVEWWVWTCHIPATIGECETREEAERAVRAAAGIR